MALVVAAMMVEHRVLTDEELEEHDRRQELEYLAALVQPLSRPSSAIAAILLTRDGPRVSDLRRRQAIIDQAMEVLFADSLDDLAEEELRVLHCDSVIGGEDNYIEQGHFWTLPAGALPAGAGWRTTPQHHAEADQRSDCTGMAARWCPIHGDCTCDEADIAYLTGDREDDPDDDGEDDGQWHYPGVDKDGNVCPLHGPTSTHAEADQ